MTSSSVSHRFWKNSFGGLSQWWLAWHELVMFHRLWDRVSRRALFGYLVGAFIYIFFVKDYPKWLYNIFGKASNHRLVKQGFGLTELWAEECMQLRRKTSESEAEEGEDFQSRGPQGVRGRAKHSQLSDPSWDDTCVWSFLVMAAWGFMCCSTTMPPFLGFGLMQDQGLWIASSDTVWFLMPVWFGGTTTKPDWLVRSSQSNSDFDYPGSTETTTHGKGLAIRSTMTYLFELGNHLNRPESMTNHP